ncbi:MAG: hypothetical protein WBA54_14265 [Acidaminobacteraceae bacterium]
MGYFAEHNITLPKELIERLASDEDYLDLLGDDLRDDLRVQFNLKRIKPARKDEELRLGYENMASINLSFAEMGLISDVSSLEDYEGILSTPVSKKVDMEQKLF